MIIRDATETDLPALRDIFNDAVLNTTAIWMDNVVDLANRQAWFAARAGHLRTDARLRQSMWKLAVAGIAMGLVLWLAYAPVAAFMSNSHGFRDLLTLTVVGTLGAVVYGGIVFALFGRDWLKAFRARRRS